MKQPPAKKLKAPTRRKTEKSRLPRFSEEDLGPLPVRIPEFLLEKGAIYRIEGKLMVPEALKGLKALSKLLPAFAAGPLANVIKDDEEEVQSERILILSDPQVMDDDWINKQVTAPDGWVYATGRSKEIRGLWFVEILQIADRETLILPLTRIPRDDDNMDYTIYPQLPDGTDDVSGAILVTKDPPPYNPSLVEMTDLDEFFK